MKRVTILLLVVVFCAALMMGCETRAERQGAIGGAIVGGAAGQIIGKDTKSTVIGAGVGAVGGSVLNKPGVQQENKKR